MDIQTRLRQMIQGVQDVQDKNVPLHAGSLTGLLADCKQLLELAEVTLSMVDTNNRIAEGDAVNPATRRARKAWNGSFVRDEVRRVLAALRSNSNSSAESAG